MGTAISSGRNAWTHQRTPAGGPSIWSAVAIPLRAGATPLSTGDAPPCMKSRPPTHNPTPAARRSQVGTARCAVPVAKAHRRRISALWKLGSAPAPGAAADALVRRRERASASSPPCLFLYQHPEGVPRPVPPFACRVIACETLIANGTLLACCLASVSTNVCGYARKMGMTNRFSGP